MVYVTFFHSMINRKFANQNEVPDPDEGPKFDPQYGFPNGRKERVMIATEEELISANLPKDRWTYCAHTYLAYKRCYRDNFPRVARCIPEEHDISHCENEDFIMRLKEFERERRLMVRAERKRKKAEKAALENCA